MRKYYFFYGDGEHFTRETDPRAHDTQLRPVILVAAIDGYVGSLAVNISYDEQERQAQGADCCISLFEHIRRDAIF